MDFSYRLPANGDVFPSVIFDGDKRQTIQTDNEENKHSSSAPPDWMGPPGPLIR